MQEGQVPAPDRYPPLPSGRRYCDQALRAIGQSCDLRPQSDRMSVLHLQVQKEHVRLPPQAQEDGVRGQAGTQVSRRGQVQARQDEDEVQEGHPQTES